MEKIQRYDFLLLFKKGRGGRCGCGIFLPGMET